MAATQALPALAGLEAGPERHGLRAEAEFVLPVTVQFRLQAPWASA